MEAAELLAFRDGLKLAANWAILVNSIECDSLQVVHSIHFACTLSAISPVYEDVKALFRLVSYGSCYFIPREGNRVAHELANSASQNPNQMYWVDSCPMFISNSVRSDFDC